MTDEAAYTVVSLNLVLTADAKHRQLYSNAQDEDLRLRPDKARHELVLFITRFKPVTSFLGSIVTRKNTLVV